MGAAAHKFTSFGADRDYVALDQYKAEARDLSSFIASESIMALPSTPELERALVAACEEFGLQEWYRDCVRPLLGKGESEWPSCCGGACEPCNQTLVNVARRVHAVLGIARNHERP
jgi:hypothetical protein